MRRLGPRHWWTAPLFAILGAGMGVAVTVGGQVVAGMIVGASLGFVCGALAATYRMAVDNRLDRIQGKRPSGVVIRGVRPKYLANRPLAAFAELPFGEVFNASFDADGMTLWTREADPVPRGEIPWSHISEVAVGDWWNSGTQYAPSFRCLRLTLFVDGKVAELVFGVETGQSGFTALRYMNEYHLAALVQQINDARERVVRIRPSWRD